jgi:hypothetical protein
MVPANTISEETDFVGLCPLLDAIAVGNIIDAVWAGGADGGAYIKCTVDAVGNVDRCSIWNDFTGQSTGPQDYMLLRDHRAATDSELQYTGAANDSIFLQHGMILRRR